MANNHVNARRWATIVIYRECQRDFSMNRGRYVGDGCHEFLKVGDDRAPEVYFCGNCGCHRNFHRKEEVPIHVEPQAIQILRHVAAANAAPPPPHGAAPPPPVAVLAPHPHRHPPPQNPAPAPAANNQDENLGDGEVEVEVGETADTRRKERTRFTPAQKDAMRAYAERLEWSLQGHNEEELRHFCSAIGITPQVFKVWMKNNRRRYNMEAGESSSAAAGRF
ncbi:hypothetical protein U1Q18_035476 [Sarracenia purpurea var. burkii]